MCCIPLSHFKSHLLTIALLYIFLFSDFYHFSSQFSMYITTCIIDDVTFISAHIFVVTIDKGKPDQSQGRKATDPRFLRDPRCHEGFQDRRAADLIGSSLGINNLSLAEATT